MQKTKKDSMKPHLTHARPSKMMLLTPQDDSSVSMHGDTLFNFALLDEKLQGVDEVDTHGEFIAVRQGPIESSVIQPGIHISLLIYVYIPYGRYACTTLCMYRKQLAN